MPASEPLRNTENVERGTYTNSSGLPLSRLPFGLITPITLNGTFLIVREWPIASPSGKNLVAILLPSTTTRAFCSTSAWEKNLP